MNMSEVGDAQSLAHIHRSPKDMGKVVLMVRRPDTDEREELLQAELDLELGLVGDNWLARGDRKTADGAANPDKQLNLMNARAIAHIAGDRERWKLAGDQFFVDLDLSQGNLPPGTRLQIGEAVIQVTPEPHLGCKKFMERFGKEATVLVNSKHGKALNLRGINARVLVPGRVALGDPIKKLLSEDEFQHLASKALSD